MGHNIKSKSPKEKGDLLKQLRNKKYGKEYWHFKTNKGASDFGIAEELIVAKEIPNIIKYIKKIYLNRYPNKQVVDLLDKLNIPYEIINYDYRLSNNLKKNIKTSLFSKPF